MTTRAASMQELLHFHQACLPVLVPSAIPLGSKLHTKLVVQEDGVVVIRPMYKSTFPTPTLLNNRPISRHQDHILSDEDIIQIGAATFQVDFVPRHEPVSAAALEVATQGRSVRQPLPLGSGAPMAARAAASEARRGGGSRVAWVTTEAEAAGAEAEVGSTSTAGTAPAAATRGGLGTAATLMGGTAGEAVARCDGPGCSKLGGVGMGLLRDLAGRSGPPPRKRQRRVRRRSSSSSAEDVEEGHVRAAGWGGWESMNKSDAAAGGAAAADEGKRYSVRKRQRPREYWRGLSSGMDSLAGREGSKEVVVLQERLATQAAAAKTRPPAYAAAGRARAAASGVGTSSAAPFAAVWAAGGQLMPSQLRCKGFPVAADAVERYKRISKQGEGSVGTEEGGLNLGEGLGGESDAGGAVRNVGDGGELLAGVYGKAATAAAAAGSEACRSAKPGATPNQPVVAGVAATAGTGAWRSAEAGAAVNQLATAAPVAAAALEVEAEGVAPSTAEGAAAPAAAVSPAFSDDMMGLEWSSDEEPWGCVTSSKHTSSSSSGGEGDSGPESGRQGPGGTAALGKQQQKEHRKEEQQGDGVTALRAALGAIATRAEELAAARPWGGSAAATSVGPATAAAAAGRGGGGDGFYAGLGAWPVRTLNAHYQQQAAAEGRGATGKLLQIRLKTARPAGMQQGHGSSSALPAAAAAAVIGARTIAPTPQHSNGSSKKITIKRHNSSSNLSSSSGALVNNSSSSHGLSRGPYLISAAAANAGRVGPGWSTAAMSWGGRRPRSLRQTGRRLHWGATVVLPQSIAALAGVAGGAAAYKQFCGVMPRFTTSAAAAMIAAAGATWQVDSDSGSSLGSKRGRLGIRKFRSLSKLYPLAPGAVAKAAAAGTQAAADEGEESAAYPAIRGLPGAVAVVAGKGLLRSFKLLPRPGIRKLLLEQQQEQLRQHLLDLVKEQQLLQQAQAEGKEQKDVPAAQDQEPQQEQRQNSQQQQEQQQKDAQAVQDQQLALQQQQRQEPQQQQQLKDAPPTRDQELQEEQQQRRTTKQQQEQVLEHLLQLSKEQQLQQQAKGQQLQLLLQQGQQQQQDRLLIQDQEQQQQQPTRPDLQQQQEQQQRQGVAASDGSRRLIVRVRKPSAAGGNPEASAQGTGSEAAAGAAGGGCFDSCLGSVVGQSNAGSKGTAVAEAAAVAEGAAVAEETAVAAVPAAGEGTAVGAVPAVVSDESEAVAKGLIRQPLVAEGEVMCTAKYESSRGRSSRLPDLRMTVRLRGFRRALTGAKAGGGAEAEAVTGLMKQEGRSTTTKEVASATAFTAANADVTADADATNAAFTAAAAPDAAAATAREVCPPAVAAAAAERSCKFAEPRRGCSSSIREGVAPAVGGLVRLLAPGCYCLTVNGIVDQQGHAWHCPLQELAPTSTLSSSSKGDRSRGEAGSCAVQRPVLLLKHRLSCNAARVGRGDGGAATAAAATAAAAGGGGSGGSGSATGGGSAG